MILARIVDNRFHEALNKLALAPLPLKTAFKLKGISKVVREEYAKYEEVRQAALKNHGEKNEDGSLKLDETGNVKFSQDGMIAFAKDMGELTALEINLPGVKVSELGNINLTLADLEQLDGIVVED